MPADTVALARALIGAFVVSDSPQGRVMVRIVETEAYLSGDAAAHSFGGETGRNRTLFGRRGHAYVYFIYGMYYCLNVSSERSGVGAGVLLRAGEPVTGIDLMASRRGGSALRDLCRGPGRLASALAIDRRHDGLDLTVRGPLWLAAPLTSPNAIDCTPRIGVTKEAARMLRFFESGSPYVSGTTKSNARGAAQLQER